MKKYILALFAAFVCSALFAQTSLKVIVGPPQPFQNVDQSPTFNGGSVNDFSQWVEKNISLPNVVLKKKEVNLVLQFTVKSDGNVANVDILKISELCHELIYAAVGTVSRSPAWQPAIKNGKAVRVSYILPMTFKQESNNQQQDIAKSVISGADDKEIVSKTEKEHPNPLKSDVDNIAARTNRTAANTFALIIANENYHNVSAVEYANNDGKMFSEYCDKVLGVPQSNIRLYTDATLGTIYSAVKFVEKVGEAYDGDINLIVYYAGHGIPDEASKDAYIIPTDGDGSVLQSCIKLSDLYGRLAAIKSKSTVVFMDACFSGSLRGDGMLASARGVAIASKPTKVGGNMVVISAAQGDETAYPLKEEGHGMFTYYILKKLQETGGNVTLGEMSDYLVREVKRRSITTNGKIQTPSVAPSALATDWRNWKL